MKTWPLHTHLKRAGCCPTRATNRLLQVAVPAVLLAVTFHASPSRAAERASDQLSVDTVAYLRFHHVAELAERIDQLAIARALRDPEVSPLVEHLYGGSLGPALRKLQDESGVTIDQLLGAIRGELVVSLIALPAFKPALTLMFRAEPASEEDETAEQILRVGAQRMSEAGFAESTERIDDVDVQLLRRDEGPIQEVVQLRLGSYRVITTQRRVAEQLIALHLGADIPTLAMHPPFRTIITRCAPQTGSRSGRDPAQVEWYVDPIALARSLLRGNLSATVGLAILPAIGADGIQAIGGTVNVIENNFDLITRTHLLIEPPRSGVTKMAAIGSGSMRPEAWVPADAAEYSTWHLQLETIYDTLEELFDSFREEGALHKAVTRRFSEPLGVEFRDDILLALTGRITHYVQFDRPVSITSQANVVGLGLNDPVAFKTTLEAIVDKWSQRIETSDFAGTTIYRILTPDSDASESRESDEARQDGDDRRSRRSRMREQRRRSAKPAMAIVGDTLLLTDRVTSLEQAIMTQGDVGDRLRDALDFKLLASQLKRQSETKPGMLRFQRPDESLKVLYELVRTPEFREEIHKNRETNPFVNALHTALEDDAFPPFEVILEYLAPSGSILVNEDSGLHHVGFALKRSQD